MTSRDIPRMCTIKETAALFGLSVYFIRRKVAEGEIVAVDTGKKFLVNTDKLVEYLNTHRMGNEPTDKPPEKTPHGKIKPIGLER